MVDSTQPGFNIYGFISCNIGLGVAARTTIALLTGCGYEVAVYDIPLPGRSGADTTFTDNYNDLKTAPPNAINIFHLNPPQLRLIDNCCGANMMTGKLNVMVPFWELPRIPDSWAPLLEKTDIILAPSRFIEQAVASYTSRCRVLYYPQAILDDFEHRSDRSVFGLPENSFLFVMSFDIGSDLIRKNPVGVIDAFKRAFTDTSPAAGLIIKINKTVGGPFFENLAAKLHQYIDGDKRIRIIDKTMSHDEVMALYSSCDCYVSLHRAEGLGLGVMEAMSLGKPVIATFWSGTADFMTPVNCCPVTYNIVKCDPLFNPGNQPEQLGFQGVWAEPDLSEAASWMKTLVRSPEHCRRIGAAARKSMLDRRELVKKGHIFEQVRALQELYHQGIYS